MTKEQYSEEFKEQLIKECQEVGNVSLVVRRHEISAKTIHGWIRKLRERGTVKSLPRRNICCLGTINAADIKPAGFYLKILTWIK